MEEARIAQSQEWKLSYEQLQQISLSVLCSVGRTESFQLGQGLGRFPVVGGKQ